MIWVGFILPLLLGFLRRDVRFMVLDGELAVAIASVLGFNGLFAVTGGIVARVFVAKSRPMAAWISVAIATVISGALSISYGYVEARAKTVPSHIVETLESPISIRAYSGLIPASAKSDAEWMTTSLAQVITLPPGFRAITTAERCWQRVFEASRQNVADRYPVLNGIDSVVTRGELMELIEDTQRSNPEIFTNARWPEIIARQFATSNNLAARD